MGIPLVADRKQASHTSQSGLMRCSPGGYGAVGSRGEGESGLGSRGDGEPVRLVSAAVVTAGEPL